MGDEWIPGLSAVAAPLHIADRMRGALAVALPTPRIWNRHRDVLARRTIDSAEGPR